MKILLSIMTLAAVFGFFGQAEGAEHTKDSLDKVKEGLSQKKAVLVDVREQNEWDEGHLAGATLVPLSQLNEKAKSKEFAAQLSKDLPKDKIVYCHCRAGKRALAAGDILKELGYDVRPLKAGYQELIEAGFPQAK